MLLGLIVCCTPWGLCELLASRLSREPSAFVSGLIHTCDMTYAFVSRNCLIHVPCLRHLRVAIHLSLQLSWLDQRIYVPLLTIMNRRVWQDMLLNGRQLLDSSTCIRLDRTDTIDKIMCTPIQGAGTPCCISCAHKDGESAQTTATIHE